MMKKWTLEEENTLLDMKADGYSLKEISELLNRSYESIKTRSKRLSAREGTNVGKGGNFSWTKDQVDLLYENLSYDELTAILPFSRRAIEAKCQKLGIPKKFAGSLRYGKMKQHLPTILYLVDFGEFKKVGVTQSSVEDRFRQDKSYKLLDSVVMTLEEAVKTECEILRNMREFAVVGEIRRGSTECFNYDCTQLSDLL